MIFIKKIWVERMITINHSLYFHHWLKIFLIIIFRKCEKLQDIMVNNQHFNSLLFLMMGHIYVPVFGLLIVALYVDISFKLCLIQIMHNFILHLSHNVGIMIGNLILFNKTTIQY